MSAVVHFFKSKWFFHLLGFLALSLVIYLVFPVLTVAGHSLKSWTSGTILLIAVLWGVFILFVYTKTVRANSQLAYGLSQNQEDTDVVSDIDKIASNFHEAMETLKKTQGKDYLYAVPWYIMIGPSGSGKTTALLNAGLHFPLGRKEVKGIGGTRNCDWLFTDKAVLIDTAGRYVITEKGEFTIAESTDKAAKNNEKAWLGFLELLKKHRSRRPINGVLISMSLLDLIKQTAQQRKDYASAIRKRIEELYSYFGIRFPIYMLFTKADMIAGFNEFFAKLNEEERAQVWGVTFPDENSQDSNVLLRVDNDFDDLLIRLNAQLPARLQEEGNLAKRHLIFGFPQQMALLKENLLPFLQECYGMSRYQSVPFLRGVYFTCGTQEGTPIDRLMGILASTFNIGQSSLSFSGKGKSYFITKLLKNVVFEESLLVGFNKRIERVHTMLRVGIIAGAVFLFVLITGLWSTSYLLNQSKLNEVTKQLKAYDETFTKAPPPISEWGINFSRVLARLEKMQEIQQIYPTDASIMMGFGLYQGEDLQKDLQKTYEQILQNQLLPLIKDRLEKRIKDQLNTSDTDTLAMLLKAYKDLGDEGAKQKMTDDIRLIKGDWVKLYQPQHDTDTPKKLAKHLNNLYQIPFQSFQLNTSLIDEAKLKIGVDPASEIYRHIQEESSERTDYVPFNLATKLGSSAAQAFAMDNETVPFLFTYDGFAVFLKKLAEKIIQFEEKDKLVHTGVDSQQLAATVRQHYYQDYIAHWEKLLNKIKVKPTSTFAQLNEVLMAVQGPNSVMRKLLEIVKKETALTQSIPDPLAIAKKTQLGLAVDKVLASEAKTTQSDEVLGKKVEDHFQPLIELVTVPAGGVAKFDETNAALKTLASCMVTIKGNIDKGTPQDNPECLAAIEQLKMQSALPAPIGNMLKTLADKSESTISGVNTSKLNEAWKSEVFSVYQTLKTRYPFNKHSSEEVALADFTKMFAPVGALNSFFNTRFKNSAEWNTNERAKAQIQRSLNFGNMFFALGSPTPLIKFTLKLVSLSPEASGFTLSINGDSHTFLVGDDLRQAFQWPGTGDVVFHFQTGTEKKMDKEISGIWALFKALEEAHITRQSQKTYRLTFVQDDLQAEYELRADYDDNPFSLKEFAQFNLPSSL